MPGAGWWRKHLTAQSVYEKFILNESDVQIEKENVIVKLKKKRNLPLILETMKQFEPVETPFLKNKKLVFQGASYS